MINLGPTDFVGILLVIGTFAYLTNALQWGLFQVLEHFFDDKQNKVFHHHFHYKSKR